MTTVQFGNPTTGIKDPSVFNIPDYCASAIELDSNSTNPMSMAALAR